MQRKQNVINAMITSAVREYVASFSDDIASEEFVRIVDDYNVRDGFCVDGDITEIDDDFSEKNQSVSEQLAEQEEDNHYSEEKVHF